MNYEEAYALLSAHHQEHLLRCYPELEKDEQEKLLEQIGSLDLELADLVKDAAAAPQKRGVLSPLSAITLEDIREKEQQWHDIGLEAIRRGETGAVLLAGGQGTRLGFDHPKGAYNIGITRDLFIFQCLIRNLLDVVQEAGVMIPLYIMTSEKNHEETVSFFREKDYFGYDPSYIAFFMQDMAPCIDENGKYLLESKSRIAVSPNGNGGWYASLLKAGLRQDLEKRGVRYLSAFSVDNVCQRINDPVFVGAFIDSGADCAGKAVRKRDPEEKVGVLCLEDGQPSIVEYYEMTDEMRTLRDENGDLRYAFGVTLNYLFRVNVLDRIVAEKLPIHFALKKVPYLGEDGVPVSPEAPNAYKCEYLILDMIHMTDSCLPYEVVREKEFAPVKNAVGVDSVESARELLRKNGVTV